MPFSNKAQNTPVIHSLLAQIEKALHNYAEWNPPFFASRKELRNGFTYHYTQIEEAWVAFKSIYDADTSDALRSKWMAVEETCAHDDFHTSIYLAGVTGKQLLARTNYKGLFPHHASLIISSRRDYEVIELAAGRLLDATDTSRGPGAIVESQAKVGKLYLVNTAGSDSWISAVKDKNGHWHSKQTGQHIKTPDFIVLPPRIPT